MASRREFYRAGSLALGGLLTLALAVPGVAYLLTPVLRRKAGASGAGGGDEGYFALARLSELAEGVPKSFTILAERQDAWVRYPREPMGSVWLVRQPAGAGEPVVAFTSECPHLGCSVNLAADGKSFACPCHNSSFTMEGKPTNAIPPRPMDTLAVKLSGEDDPTVSVRFERYRTMAEEKIPLG